MGQRIFTIAVALALIAAAAPERGVAACSCRGPSGNMACAITASHEVYCWGSFPDGHSSSKHELPVKMRFAE